MYLLPTRPLARKSRYTRSPPLLALAHSLTLLPVRRTSTDPNTSPSGVSKLEADNVVVGAKLGMRHTSTSGTGGSVTVRQMSPSDDVTTTNVTTTGAAPDHSALQVPATMTLPSIPVATTSRRPSSSLLLSVPGRRVARTPITGDNVSLPPKRYPYYLPFNAVKTFSRLRAPVNLALTPHMTHASRPVQLRAPTRLALYSMHLPFPLPGAGEKRDARHLL